jgi:hypothetical protein
MQIVTEPQWVGIDVSQAKLDIALRPAGSTWQIRNRIRLERASESVIGSGDCLSRSGIDRWDGTGSGAGLTAT